MGIRLSAGRPRIVTLCGSIRPLFSGTDDYNERLSAALRGRGLEVTPVDIGVWGMAAAGRLLSAVRQARPDAIMLQYPTDAFGHSLLPHVFALLQRIAPLVVVLHEFTGAHPLRRLSIGPLLARAAAVVVTAEREADAVRAWFPWLRRRLRLIPIGANVPSRPWLPGAPQQVVYFGQIRPAKGIEAFIDCRTLLAARAPDAQFTIIGSRVPQFSAYFDQVAALAREHAIKLDTQLDLDQVADALSAATLAVLPYPDGASLRRGSLLATAVCGVPVITTIGPDTPAALAALLAPAATTEAMASLAASWLADPAALGQAHEDSQRIAAMAGWPMIADRFVELLGRLPQPARAAAVALGAA